MELSFAFECPDPSSVAFFQSLPHTETILSSPDYVAVPTASRVPKHSTTEDSFFASTLATPTTIPYLISLRLKNPPPIRIVSQSDAPSLVEAHKPELLSLLHMNPIGSSGHPYTAHGGLLVTIMDEILGVLQAFHQKRASYTATMSVDFIKPVLLPATLLCRAWIEKGDGKRKCWNKAEILRWKRGNEDGKGEWELCNRCTGLWIEAREKL